MKKVNEMKLSTPDAFLKFIDKNLEYESAMNNTFIIMGKSGPTGKTTLKQALIDRELNAIEISENMLQYVSYNDDTNHFVFDSCNRTYIIVLNKQCINRKPLQM